MSEDHDNETQDRLDGVTAELASALGVLWRRGDAESRTWIFLNFPGWARTAAIYSEFSLDPYIKFEKRLEPSP